MTTAVKTRNAEHRQHRAAHYITPATHVALPNGLQWTFILADSEHIINL